MKSPISRYIVLAICLILATGCATFRAQKIRPTDIQQAQKEAPENQLLDVGILVFESEELNEKDAEEEGTTPGIRKAENQFIPYHLKNTLQRSSHWGAIQVVPSGTEQVDLMVRGKIHKSNGEYLMLEIKATDASGKTWLEKKYLQEVSEHTYSNNKPGEKDAFQDIYNTIANDLAELKKDLTPAEIEKIRTISKLKFAQDFAPERFQDYLKEEKEETVINRLPAGEDPMMDRLLKIREREFMYLDTLNQYYEGFYNEMWDSYENWRKLNLTERAAMKKVKNEALVRKIIGVLLITGAIVLGTDSNDSVFMRTSIPTMVVIGGQVIVSGFNVSKEAEIHAAAIKELSESFNNEMRPVVMELEGNQYQLTGSAEEQFRRWRELLRKIYAAETGLSRNGLPIESKTDKIP